jgi:glutamine synthetase
MTTGTSLEMTLLSGARALLASHAREAPQRDDLCGAFCGALALRAAGVAAAPGSGEPIDQDVVALAAGSVVGLHTDPAILPFDERGRRDYRLELPFVEDSSVSGTTATGLAAAVQTLSAGRLAVIPFSGPWTPETLDGLFELSAALERPVTLLANLATRHLWGSHPRAEELLAYLLDGESTGPPPDWDVGHFVCVIGRVRGPAGSFYGVADTYPSLGSGGVHLQPRERLAAAIDRRDMPAGGVLVVVDIEDASAVRSGAGALGLIEGIWDNGTVPAADAGANAFSSASLPAAPLPHPPPLRTRDGHRDRQIPDPARSMSATDLVALVCCDLGAIVRGRALAASDLDAHLAAGVGWVPANHALTPLGPLAEPSPFDSTGDLRLRPDPQTRVRVESGAGDAALELVLCDIIQTDGAPWECCPRTFLRDALAELRDEHGLTLVASFEHEFQLLSGEARSSDAGVTDGTPAALPFSLEELRRAEPFAGEVVGALAAAGVQPERFFAEFAAHQFEIPVRPAEGLAAADRAVVLREVVRDVARRHERRATFTPLLHPAEAGNGVHIHLSLLDASGRPALYDAARPGCLSELGERFAAGILLHARALTALTAPSPVSATRLAPHHWSAGAVCLGQRNRETLLRLPPLVSLGGGDPAGQLRLEYRGADGAANPYLALGAIVRAGLDGVRAGLPAPPILDRDPAQLDASEAVRYGVGALPATLAESLEALAEDTAVRECMTPLLYEAYAAVKRFEVAATTDLDVEELCRRYASIY